ncbi:glycosyl transferase family 2 [Halalkaliarchaeum desulfuricum]|uniref:Glycosyl transferase family 2 n=1 Tax=Halalkaliarchaeum desulfuricum TaxID=2055893 RepID=A0A343TJ86_9EURY|nr:glycosyltransferase family A protein [Halalkaliarchaeum desulfuricum]AUX09158.1 glycosyl transferase family 2 [Halalkaliarchaeum desulfuricum]
MELSVVVPTLNGRDRLSACLDALAAHAPDAEVIVANGPSADGTTGMVRDRDDVDVLVEISDRSVNVARNAGIEVASGDAVALVDFDRRVTDGWQEAVLERLESAPVVTGPSLPIDREAPAVDGPEHRRIAGREVRYFTSGNVAFRRGVLEVLDGFDEYLNVGGARDAAHRLAGLGHEIAWNERMSVGHEPLAEGGHDWREKYRALGYRLAKNYGVRPGVVRTLVGEALCDARTSFEEVIRGEGAPTAWIGNGWRVARGSLEGSTDGIVARARDRSPSRNPRGLSVRHDRAVALYDRRDGRVER